MIEVWSRFSKFSEYNPLYISPILGEKFDVFVCEV